MTLRLQGKRFYCTWPRNTTTIEDVVTNLTCGPHANPEHKDRGDYDLDWFVIGQEQHKDGTPHLHAAFAFMTKKNFKDPSVFDYLAGKHGNYQTIRSLARVIRYCIKDGKYQAEGIDVSTYQKESRFVKALAAETVKEGLSILCDADAGDYMKNLQRYEYALNKHIQPPTEVKYKPEDFTVDLLDLTLPVVIWGRSGLGKTEFAKAHFKNPLIVSHVDDLKKFDKERHDGLIFDDMTFSHWPYNSVIHLLDMNNGRSIHCRNTNGYIPAGTKRIFTINPEKEEEPYCHIFPEIFYTADLGSARKRAINRRFVKFEVVDSIIRTTTTSSNGSDTEEEETNLRRSVRDGRGTSPERRTMGGGSGRDDIGSTRTTTHQDGGLHGDDGRRSSGEQNRDNGTEIPMEDVEVRGMDVEYSEEEKVSQSRSTLRMGCLPDMTMHHCQCGRWTMHKVCPSCKRVI